MKMEKTRAEIWEEINNTCYGEWKIIPEPEEQYVIIYNPVIFYNHILQKEEQYFEPGFKIMAHYKLTEENIIAVLYHPDYPYLRHKSHNLLFIDNKRNKHLIDTTITKTPQEQDKLVLILEKYECKLKI